MKKLITLAIAVSSFSAFAKDFPQREIFIQVPFSPGTSADPLAREFGMLLSKNINKAVIVENKMGAEGQIGAKSVLNSKPDGHTILFTSSSQPVYDPILKDNLPYDFEKDFTPLCTLSKTTNVLNVSSTGKIKSAKQLINEAKKNPGDIKFAYSTSAQRIAALTFMKATGIELSAIPYKSGMTALTDLAGGQVDAIFVDHLSTKPLVEAGKLLPLAVAGDKRVKIFPDAPTSVELGIEKYDIQPWFGFYISAKTPENTKKELVNIFEKTLLSEENKKNIENRGLIPFSICGGDFSDFQKSEINKAKSAVF